MRFILPIVLLSISVILWFISLQRRQKILGGSLVFFSIVFLGSAAMVVVFQNSEMIRNEPIMMYVITILLGLFIASVVLLPILLICLFIFNGIKVILKEGFSFSNLLSLLFGVGLVGYLFFWDKIRVVLSQNIVTELMFVIINFILIILFTSLALFSFSNIYCQWHFKKRWHFDYIVVLGSGLNKDQLTLLLKGRVNKGIQLLSYNPHAQLIMSGGQGDDELIAEATAMANYAIAQGVDESKIIVENQSVNTAENIKFSRKKMTKAMPKVALVTTNYHVQRALMLADKQGLKCIGFGSKTKFYFYLNALLREYVAYLKQVTIKHPKLLIALFIMVIVLRIILLWV